MENINNIRRFSIISWLLFILIIIANTNVFADEDIKLSWDPNTEPDLAGYKVYYKIDSQGGAPYDGAGQLIYQGNPVDSPFDVGNITQVTLTIPSEFTEDNFFFVVTAYDDGTPSRESDYSNEVSTQETTPPSDTDPTISVFEINGNSGSSSVYTDEDVSVTIEASDDGEVTQYLILQDNNDPTGETFSNLSSPGASVTVGTDFTLTGEGNHTLYAWVKDETGNISSRATKTNVILDSTPPSGSISYNTLNTSHVDVGDLIITATFNEGLQNVPYIIINMPGSMPTVGPVLMTEQSSNIYTYSLTIQEHNGTSSATDGTSTITVSNIIDRAGNQATSLVSNFTTDTIDTDNDGVRNYVDNDDDGDLLPDDFEEQYSFLDPLDPSDAAEDQDGDGISNLEEYLNETNPMENDNNVRPETPILISPVNDDLVDLDPTLMVSEFYDSDIEDIHTETEWQIFRILNNNTKCIFEITSSEALTSLIVPSLILDAKKDYSWRVRFFDNHGQASEWSAYGYFTTSQNNSDLDNNGVLDSQEVDSNVDLDGNGIADIDEINIKSVRVKDKKDKLIGLGTKDSPKVIDIVSFHSKDPNSQEIYPEMDTTPGVMPFGLVDFKVLVESPGDQAELIIYFSEEVPQESVWYKYDSIQNTWIDFSDYAILGPTRKSLRLYLQDGGPGDADGIANGVIVDPSGLVSLTTLSTLENSTMDYYVSESDGCFIDSLRKSPGHFHREP